MQTKTTKSQPGLVIYATRDGDVGTRCRAGTTGAVGYRVSVGSLWRVPKIGERFEIWNDGAREWARLRKYRTI